MSQSDKEEPQGSSDNNQINKTIRNDGKDAPLRVNASFGDVNDPTQSFDMKLEPVQDTPTQTQYSQVGRYRIQGLIGRGSFGEVYLGLDELLKRDVAIKLTYGQRVGLDAVKMFLVEAQILAELDHPNIVPIFDSGTTDRGDIYIVSKFIDGSDLASRVQHQRPTRSESLEIVKSIADALQHSHSRGLIHRDVKPGNILLDKSNRPYLADFGLALRDTDQIQERVFAGTPAYMSPEQIRGEGHLVTNLSDIYSLGVVLYELITGRLPFRAESARELARKVHLSEVRSPRVFDASISNELERVCLKALSKRPSDRYTVADDFANDIRALIDQKSKSISSSSNAAPVTEAVTRADSNQRNVIPKGVKSFDQFDADFYLELLPGPFHRSGLPESIWFWKSRIESTLPAPCFRLGLIYGPSGCGKSSLMKAGLLPKLSSAIDSIYIEASPEETERKLLSIIHDRYPELASQSLVESLSSIRRRKLLPAGGKLLIVIDQFEQWLHGKNGFESQVLTDAIRQSDGINIQFILMVRDDFWVSVCRFFREVDIPIVERDNSMMVDLFDIEHSKKVLTDYGIAYKKLRDQVSKTNTEQERFIERSVLELSQDLKVIPMRLSLYAEMIKGRNWNLETLESLGGISGVGVAFLQQSFASRYSPIEYRQHREAAKNVLSDLLPPLATNIIGAKKTADQLRVSSGYGSSDRDFEHLIQILSHELKLITAVDSLGGEPSYQLTHDYLVPSIREWLNQQKRETSKGRAELKLSERASIWSALKEKKQIPSFMEWLQIKRWTSKSRWSLPEAEMMNRADRFHYTRLLAALSLALGLIGFALGWRLWSAFERQRQEEDLVRSLRSSEIENVPYMLQKIAAFRPPIDRRINSALEQSYEGSRGQINLSLGSLGQSSGALSKLGDYIPRADMGALPVLIRSLKPYASQLTERLWEIAMEKDPATLLNTACALASYDPYNEAWNDISEHVVNQLVNEDPVRIGFWIEAFRPVRRKLIPELTEKYFSSDVDRSPEVVDLATDILGFYVEDLETMHELVLNGSPKQFSMLFPKYQMQKSVLVERLRQELEKVPVGSYYDDDVSVRFAYQRSIHRRANAAVALFQIEGLSSIHEFITVDQDPSKLTEFIFAMKGRIQDPMILVDSYRDLQSRPLPEDRRLRQQHCIRMYAMLLGLGDLRLEQIPISNREKLIEDLIEQYRVHPSRTIHSATGWLLRRWGESLAVQKVDRTPLSYDPTSEREWYVVKADAPSTKKLYNDEKSGALRSEWPEELRSVFFTMIVFPGGEYQKGKAGESMRANIDGSIAVSDKELTDLQFATLIDYETYSMRDSEWWIRHNQETIRKGGYGKPTIGISWFEAVNFCRLATRAVGLLEDQQCYAPKDLPVDENDRVDFGKIPMNEDWPMETNRAGFRLPTATEWEYVARAGSTTHYCFGSNERYYSEYGWYLGGSSEENFPFNAGELRPSIGGLFDIHGNASEWLNDFIDEKYIGRREHRGGNCVWPRLFGRVYVRPAEDADYDEPHLPIGVRIVQKPQAP